VPFNLEGCILTRIFKWVPTTLAGEPAVFYAERAVNAGWKKSNGAAWNTGAPEHYEGFDLYYRDDREPLGASEPHKQAVRNLEAISEKWLRDGHPMMPTRFIESGEPSLRLSQIDGKSGLRRSLEEWYRPENLDLYPDRKAELDAANASREEYFKRQRLPTSVLEKLLSE